jgi:Putative esterase
VPLREVDGSAGPPWQPELRGRLDQLVVESEVLTGNPLGDPRRRPLYVYMPAGVREHDRLPAVYLLQGYGGQLDEWLARNSFEPTVIERFDAMFARDECPPALLVFVDAWTSLGGSQFLNSTATGRYMDYLCDEVVSFVDARYPTAAAREHRGVAGKSSGGYGAIVTSMLRPDVFGAFASRSGDALFEYCYLPMLPAVARAVRVHFGGSFERLREHVEQAEQFDWDLYGGPLSCYAAAAAYSPDPERPGEVLLPFDPATGRIVEEVWQRWLEWDPVRMAPRHADALRSMRGIYLDAGRSDEFFLDLGAQAIAKELDELSVPYTLELYDGTHGGNAYRYPGAIRALIQALAD